MTLKDAVYQLNALRGRRPLRALHLFAGAGGSVLAGRALGWESVGAVELDPFCCRVLERHGERVLHQDITTFDARSLRGQVDVVVGGFPCQDLSSAGRRAGFKRGKRSILFFEMMRVVDETQAPVVFAENVRGLLSSHEGRDFAAVLHRMAQSGFDARWCLLGADDAGAPHQRKRVWILAHRPEHRWGQGQSGPGQWQGQGGLAAGGGQPPAMAYPAGGGRRQSGPEHAPAVPDGAGAGVAHADISHGHGSGNVRAGGWAQPANGGGHGGENLALAPGPGLQVRDGVGARGLGERGPHAAVAAPPGRPAEPGVGGATDGLAGGVDHAAAGAGGLAAAQRWPAGRGEDQHPWEAPRVTGRGEAWRVPRLRALGNGWVPQTAVLAWRILTEEE